VKQISNLKKYTKSINSCQEKFAKFPKNSKEKGALRWSRPSLAIFLKNNYKDQDSTPTLLEMKG